MPEKDDNIAAPAGESAAGNPVGSALRAQQRMLDSSAGYRALALMDGIKRIAYIFQANVTQYNGLVARLQDPGFSLPIFDMRNPGAHDDLLSEAERLLHNVLAAMSTRVDQQRAFMKTHFSSDAELTKEYLARVSTTFIADMLSKFLKDLRNQMAHHQLPVAQGQQTFTRESIAITFTLPAKPLLGWEDWSSGVKEWIASQGKDVAIVDVVNEYARKAADHDKWLLEKIRLKYETEIREYRQAAEAYQREYDRVFGL
jgi:hypothetical protein